MSWLFGTFRVFFGMAFVIWIATLAKRSGWTYLDEANASSAFWMTFAVLPLLAGSIDALWRKPPKPARVSFLCLSAGCFLMLASRPEVSTGMVVVVVVISTITSVIAQQAERVFRGTRR